MTTRRKFIGRSGRRAASPVASRTRLATGYPAPSSSRCPSCETLRLLEEAFANLINNPSIDAIADAIMADDDMGAA